MDPRRDAARFHHHIPLYPRSSRYHLQRAPAARAGNRSSRHPYLDKAVMRDKEKLPNIKGLGEP